MAMGTHSAKATILSWAAKAGLPHNVRNLLGAHALQGEVIMITCSRAALAAPMRQLEKLYAAIRAGSVDPDLTKLGRWIR